MEWRSDGSGWPCPSLTHLRLVPLHFSSAPEETGWDVSGKERTRPTTEGDGEKWRRCTDDTAHASVSAAVSFPTFPSLYVRLVSLLSSFHSWGTNVERTERDKGTRMWHGKRRKYNRNRNKKTILIKEEIIIENNSLVHKSSNSFPLLFSSLLSLPFALHSGPSLVPSVLSSPPSLVPFTERMERSEVKGAREVM